MLTTIVVHVIDAGGQYVVDGDGSTYPANGDYPNAVPMNANDYNALITGRKSLTDRLLAALGARS